MYPDYNLPPLRWPLLALLLPGTVPQLPGQLEQAAMHSLSHCPLTGCAHRGITFVMLLQLGLKATEVQAVVYLDVWCWLCLWQFYHFF